MLRFFVSPFLALIVFGRPKLSWSVGCGKKQEREESEEREEKEESEERNERNERKEWNMIKSVKTERIMITVIFDTRRK